MNNFRCVTIIGAGIVGLCCARTLQRRGRSVTVIDPDGPGSGTSFGNAGLLSTGSVLPEGHPGLWKRLPKLLLDPTGPLAIRPSYFPQMLPWLLRFFASTAPNRVEEISKALASIILPSVQHYLDLLDDLPREKIPIRQQGCLYLYPTERDVLAAAPANEARIRRGVDVEILGSNEVRQLVPAIEPDIAGGALATQSGHVTTPLALSKLLASQIEEAGGKFKCAKAIGFAIGDEGPSHVQTDQGNFGVEDVVIAAGAFSRPLAAALGNKVPLDTERGYHMMLPDPRIDVRVPMLIPSMGFAITPMSSGLRLAGTVEFAGLKAPPNYERSEILLRHAKQLFPDLNETGKEPWMGYRPSMPDSLPVISRSNDFDRVFYAFGHGHLGLSLGAVTGRIIADLLIDGISEINVAPFRADRF